MFSNVILKIFTERDVITSLGNLLQCLIILILRKFFRSLAFVFLTVKPITSRPASLGHEEQITVTPNYPSRTHS